ncbi:MAG TPA: hypothetical protein VNX01_07250, partial [Bacteroidia bacterium]|nr:hypothetical protein [Bacteroidia bacterium]
MKTEDSDDAIRKKIKSLTSPYGQEEIDAVHNYVKQQQTDPERKYYLIGFISLIGLIIFGLLTLNIFQFQKQTNLEHTIDTLKKNLAKSEANNKLIKTDTIYVNNYLVEKRSDNASVNSKNNHNNQPNVTFNNTYTTKNDFIKKSINKNIVSNSTPLSSQEKSTPLIPNGINNKSKTINTASNNKIVSYQETPSPLIPNGTYNTNNQISETIGKSEVPNKKIDPVLENSVKKDSITIPQANKSTTENDSSLSKKDTVNSTKNSNNLAITDSTANATQKREFLLTKNLDYRVGLGFEVANSQLGYSILGEMVYKKKFIIGVGLKYLSTGKELFSDDDDYHHHKNKNFKNSYAKQVQDSIHHNIKISNTVFQIPITFSYSLQLKRNFSLIFGIGTDIDLYAVQHVEYKHPITNSDYTQKKFDVKQPTLYFNNTVLSTGLQKQFKHFVFQLSPFVSPQLKNVTYKTESVYYGLRIRAY